MAPSQRGPLIRSAIIVHRWLGVTLAAVFVVWFSSGIGMMYWDFPSVSSAERLARSPRLDRSKVRLSPADAYASLRTKPPLTEVRLNTFDGRPVYRFRSGRGETIVYADTGDEQTEVSKAMMDRVASAWTGESVGGARFESIDEADQWTVEDAFRDLRPLWKYSWADGQQAYISQASGEVVQYTTTASRIGAYLGPIPHWLYFTPLRAHRVQWRIVVIWASAIGTMTAILGFSIGLTLYSPSQRYRYAGMPTGIPYRGPKRWHMTLGLMFGLGAVTWAFSGMLSMEPFPASVGSTARRGGNGDARISDALRQPVQLAPYAAKPPREALAELEHLDVKELELTTFAGESVYVATLDRGDTRVVPLAGDPQREFDRRRIIDVLTQAAQPNGRPDIRVMERYDMYYVDRRHRRPLPVILARVDDVDHSRYYVDPKTARLVATYSSRDWVSRWLYHGLHSLDFPWLYDHRPAWDIVVITFMIGGTALSLTSVILAWQAVRRRLIRSAAADTTFG